MEARHYRKDNGTAVCLLCPHSCRIVRGSAGRCRVRRNDNGQLQSLTYGRPVALNIDPVEKKPLYHFLPGSTTFSIGTIGCNLSCPHCQNFGMSFGSPGAATVTAPPKEIVDKAILAGCKSISYTYNEPTVFFEYAMDTARLARKNGLKNIIVTNGYISKEAAQEFSGIMDAANVDLKAYNDRFYRTVCGGSLAPVLRTLKIYRKALWLEVTNLVIDKINDSMKEIDEMAGWIARELGSDTPLHFSRAFPMHRMENIAPTPQRTLGLAKDAAKKHLDFVYLGNTGMPEDTKCPRCQRALILRRTGAVRERCRCGYRLAGVF